MSSSTSSGARPVFEPVDTSFNPQEHSARDDVESPSLSSGNALARFEFEAGRSKDGTKILMVEWEDDEKTKAVEGDWEVSWEGKKTVLPARDQPNGGINRLYFLLGPGVVVPPAVKLQKGASVSWRTNPLPAIFSPDLGMSATQAGKKGVLHTIWAKKRLQVLKGEIEHETKDNAEGIALEMATAEMEWIESNFGVVAKPGAGLGISTSALSGVMGGLNSPTSPRSPGGGRLMDKLKGLKIGTSERELTSPMKTSGNDAPPPAYNPLSPESSDVAVGSFGSFAALKGMPSQSGFAAKPAQPPTQRKMAAQRPPESFAAKQRQQAGSGMASLNAFASPEVGLSQAAVQGDDDDDDDLFALPMSPRSPEMSKSPFSFATQDTMKYAQGERAA